MRNDNFINSRDEKIDGPRVAAHILNSMPADKKKRLLSEIARQDQGLFQAISLNIVNFDDIVEISDVGLQRLIKEIPHKDLVLSLKDAPSSVKRALFHNMSETKKRLVEEDLENFEATFSYEQVQEAQRQVCAIIDRLRTIGAIFSRTEDEEYIE